MTLATPAISIVMPVYNGARFLERAIASLRAQTLPNWELLAVDDASTDHSATRLDQLAAADPRIQVFRHPSNRGVSATRNTALAHARGRLVAYLDCDDEFYPDHLARAWEWREKGDVLVFRYDLIEERPSSARFGTVVRYDPARRHEAMFTENITVPLGVVHQRNLLERTRVFDESRQRDEDTDLWRRFARTGAAFTFVPAASGLYHIRPDSLSRTATSSLSGGLPSPVRTAEVRVGADRYTLRIASSDAGLLREIFTEREYGGIPPGVLRSPPLIVDVGANVGVFALYAKLMLHRDATIHCFEPYPPTVALLRHNLESFPDITIHPVGLGRADSEADLFLDPRFSVCNSIRSELVPRPAGTARVLIRDAARVWDELGLTDVDVLKIDTEGCEIEILERLGPRLSGVRVVLAEFHSPADRRRIDALLAEHELFGSALRNARVGVVKYLRADLLAR